MNVLHLDPEHTYAHRLCALAYAIGQGEEISTEDVAEAYGVSMRTARLNMEIVAYALHLWVDDLGIWRTCDDARAVYTDCSEDLHEH